MAPSIISDTHDKIPLSKESLKEIDSYNLIDSKILLDVGPNEVKVRFSLLETQDSGVLTVEVIDTNTPPNVIEVVGNINFKKLCAADTCLHGGVQINSAFFNNDYRGLSLGITSYELIAKNYLLVSDKIQTHDGSAFWKFKLGDHESLIINIVVIPTTGKPYHVCDEDEQPIIYHYSREELEPMIWGLEHPSDKQHSVIKANRYKSNENVLLVAIAKE